MSYHNILFTAEDRYESQAKKEDATPQAVNKCFFDILGMQLGLTGHPSFIGTLAQAWGHPETGLPPIGQTKGSASGVPKQIKGAERDDTEIGSGWKWLFGIVGILIVLAVISGNANRGGQGAPSKPYNPTLAAQKYGVPNSNSSSGVTPEVGQSAVLQYENPPVGTDKVLSDAQIRWCLREKIRLDAIKKLVSSMAGVAVLNSRVDDYNCRCVSYRYPSGSLERIQAEVETKRKEIIDEASLYAASLDRTNGPKYEPVIQSPSYALPDTNVLGPSPVTVNEAQTLLTKLGYLPGPIDGQVGPRTTSAVMAFQASIGHIQDGLITSDLIKSLRQAQPPRL